MQLVYDHKWEWYIIVDLGKIILTIVFYNSAGLCFKTGVVLNVLKHILKQTQYLNKTVFS